MKKVMIEFKDFSFQYKAQAEPTLKNIDLAIYEGEKVLIIGPSGSGKSTIAQCLNGIIPAIHDGKVSGQLLLDGKDIFPLSIYDKSRLVSTVLQDTDGQFIGLTVAEDLAFALENDCLALDEMREKIDKWSVKLDLQSLLKQRPQDLSGGQKQRVSLAGVLIDESPILLFDEPLANLDPQSGQATIDLIDQIHQSQHTTTIIIEHRLEDVLHRSVDRIVLMNEGRVVYNGDPNTLLAGDLLEVNGIREPLYLTCLKELGWTCQPTFPLASLKELDIKDLSLADFPQEEAELPKMEALLEVEQFSYAYPHKSALSSLNMTIYKGERIALVGKNGAGKSTLAKSLCQFVTPSGSIKWKGQDISTDSIKERSERIGYVLQNPNQMISHTMIFDEVASGLRLRGLAEDVIQEKVWQVLKVCGLYEFRNWPISALSFGQKKRVTIASILVLNPEIILLDEPTAGQDQRNYTEMMTFLDQLNQQGHTIIMVTHDMQLMLDYTDRALVMLDGHLLADLSPLDLLSDTELLSKASLKQTSIFKLAEKIGLNPHKLTKLYMDRKGETHV